MPSTFPPCNRGSNGIRIVNIFKWKFGASPRQSITDEVEDGVVQFFPGADSKFYVVMVKTADGEIKRHMLMKVINTYIDEYEDKSLHIDIWIVIREE